GEDPRAVHTRFAELLDEVLDEIARIQRAAREEGETARPAWPVIVFETPKGWTGPREVDGKPVENTSRSHQVPLAGVRDDAGHRRLLEEWLRSYRPEELFDDDGRLAELPRRLNPVGTRR